MVLPKSFCVLYSFKKKEKIFSKPPAGVVSMIINIIKTAKATTKKKNKENFKMLRR